MTTFKIRISARKIGAIGMQSAGWIYTVEAPTQTHAIYEAMARAAERHGDTHEHFLPGAPETHYLVVGDRLVRSGYVPITWLEDD